MNWKPAILATAVALAGLGAERSAAAATPTDGIWISHADLMELPTSGAAWNRLRVEAEKTCPAPNLANQDDHANVCVMAKALMAARTGDEIRRGEVIAALKLVADAGPYAGRALALGRELAAYVIAADLIELRSRNAGLDQRFRARIKALLTTPTKGGPASLIKCHEERPNNWGTHCGGSRVAVAAYLGDEAELARAAAVFKGWLGDRGSYARFRFGDPAWQCDPLRPVGINPVGCLRQGNPIDGVVAEDQQRGGGFSWPPARVNYAYEALQGALAQAIILDRAGYDAFEWESQALLRAFRWLYSQANFPASGDDVWQIHVINHYYGTSYPAAAAASPGKNVGWTGWTHPGLDAPAGSPAPAPDATPVPPTAPSPPTPAVPDSVPAT